MSDRITMREAAEVAGVHRNTVRNWVKSGKFDTARLEADPDGSGEIWRIDRDELEDQGLLAGEPQTVPVTAATETETPAAATPPAPVREGYELVPMEILERLLNIAATYGEAGERVGRAEATVETLRERLDETRNELDAERHRREQVEAELARLHGFDPTIPQPATGSAKPEDPAEVRREAPAPTRDTGRVTRWDRLRQWRPGRKA